MSGSKIGWGVGVDPFNNYVEISLFSFLSLPYALLFSLSLLFSQSHHNYAVMHPLVAFYSSSWSF